MYVYTPGLTKETMNSEPFDMLKIIRVSTDVLICTGNEIECLLSQQQLVAQS